jgi:hypothetical protein
MRSFQLREICRAFQQFPLPVFFRRNQTGRTGNRRSDVRPARQLAAVLPGEVEQHGEHLGGQFDRNFLDPIEHIIPWQIIEALSRSPANVDCELVEMGRREHRRHGLALRAMAGLIHGDEALAAQIGRDVANGNAAKRGCR